MAGRGAVIPDDLAGRWQLSAWALSRVDWSLHIALAVYPVPRCFDEARRYEAKVAEVAELRRAMNTKTQGKKVRGKIPMTTKHAHQERMEL